MKNCPFCAEKIQDDAIKCRHCHEWLNKEPISNKVATAIKSDISKAEYKTFSDDGIGGIFPSAGKSVSGWVFIIIGVAIMGFTLTLSSFPYHGKFYESIFLLFLLSIGGWIGALVHYLIRNNRIIATKDDSVSLDIKLKSPDIKQNEHVTTNNDHIKKLDIDPIVHFSVYENLKNLLNIDKIDSFIIFEFNKANNIYAQALLVSDSPKILYVEIVGDDNCHNFHITNNGMLRLKESGWSLNPESLNYSKTYKEDEIDDGLTMWIALSIIETVQSTYNFKILDINIVTSD